MNMKNGNFEKNQKHQTKINRKVKFTTNSKNI